MLLEAILLLCPIPQIGSTEKAAAEIAVAAVKDSTKSSSPSQPELNAPAAKVKTDAEVADDAGLNLGAPTFAAPSGVTATPAAPIEPGVKPGAPVSAFGVVKPPSAGGYETPGQKKIWYALMAAGHGAAVFDAWSTRRAVSSGYASEANPLLRPFSHSPAMYAATQVSPLVMDLVAKKMMTSRFGLLRKTWWIPQAAGSGLSVAAGIHNMGLVPN